jgi:cytochrome c oxidase subunit 3
MSYQKHPFHLVDPSAWPLFAALGAFSSTIGGVAYFHGYSDGGYALTVGQIMIFYAMYVWFRDIIREATYEGHHTIQVQDGLQYGMILFIISEIMFFVSFFWAFFHSSLAPTVEIGAVWPPRGITILDAFHIPFLNTVILLSSGATVTWTHHALLAGARKQAIFSLIATLALGITFTGFQVVEYLEAPFSINDGIYGSTFFMATGFHGFHILIGSIFLLVCLGRILKDHFNKFHHLGFEAAALYWHMVDVVWIFLFICIYWWGGN